MWLVVCFLLALVTVTGLSSVAAVAESVTRATTDAAPVLESRSNLSCPLDLPYKYVGNTFSSKFHRPSCPFAQAMNVRHVLLFHFRCQAIAAGQVPCRYCLPPIWKTVKAVLLHGSQQNNAQAKAVISVSHSR